MSKVKQIPHSIEAEISVISALVNQHYESTKILELLKRDYFFDKRNSYLFEIVCRSMELEMVPDLVSLYEQVKYENKQEEITIEYLNKICGSPQLRPLYHARLIYEKWVSRKLIEATQKIQDRAYSESEDVFDLASASAEEIINLVEGIVPTEEQNLYDRLPQVFDNIRTRMNQEEHDSLQSTYFPTLNKWTGGIRFGDFIQVSGKDKAGKTSFAYTLSLDFAINQKVPVGVFSLEMENEVLSWKAISLECDIDYQKLRNPKGLRNGYGSLSEEELTDVALKANRRFNRAKIYTCDKVLSERQIKAKMKKMIKDFGVKFFVVDYIGLIPTTGRFESREREIAYLSRFFKLACKELGVSICVLSQQNREGKIAESKGLDRDCDFAFSIVKPLEEGVTNLTIEGETVQLTENDFIITIERSRHSLQGRQLLASYYNHRFREGTKTYKSKESSEEPEEEFDLLSKTN